MAGEDHSKWGDDFANAQSAAVKIALLKAGCDVPRHHDDMKIEVDAGIVYDANAILMDIKTEAEALTQENWSAIERVAAALMTIDLLADDAGNSSQFARNITASALLTGLPHGLTTPQIEQFGYSCV